MVGVNIAVMGYLLAGVRIFDAGTDPLIGFVSDRARRPSGRRRPYIMAGSVLVALSAGMLFAPTRSLGPVPAVWWFTAWICALFLFRTIVGPLLITAMLLKMTGIPLTESMLAAKKPAYRRHIATTDAFFPWFPSKVD